MDTTRIVGALRAEFPDLDEAVVNNAVASLDPAAVLAEERARYNARVWDRTSPINGVAAEKFLARDDVPAEGDIYLLERDGELLFFQPHKITGGPIPAGEGLAAGSAHADQMAKDEAEMRVSALARVSLARELEIGRANNKKRIEALQSTVDQLVLDLLMGGMA